MVGLTQVAHRPAGEFSKGMARRLGLAQALVNDPELLILDEPTSGLDPLGTRQVKDLILELGRRGKTILLTSHLLADVEDVCSRMVILYGGKIRAQGTATEMLADSQHTLIRAPRLDEKTIRAVEETLQRLQGVGIESVAAPRQSLEELFLDIVERARAEQIATSGAQSGGRIASFLQDDAAGATGDEVVEQLVNAAAQPAAVAAPSASRQADAAAAKAADNAVLDQLLAQSADAGRPASGGSAAPAPSASGTSSAGSTVSKPSDAGPTGSGKPRAGGGADRAVDQGVIDSLLGDSNSKEGRG